MRLLFRITGRILVPFCATVAGTFACTGAVAQARHLSWLRAGTPAEEISYLNAQRRQNGIPGGLREIPELSLGCYQYENIYVRKPGQDPHQEVPGQSGYTWLGDRAAGLSDVADGIGARPLWGNRAIDNAWANGPLHLVSLFDPLARYAWFGGGAFGACMGTARKDPLHQSVVRRFTSPAFFSLPGNGVSDVWPIQVVNDLPFAPQEAVHIPLGQPTGPNIILFPEVPRVRMARARLRSAHGRTVPLRVVTPTTPAPRYPGGWPSVRYVGEESGEVWFVIPTRPLRGGERYTLTVLWLDDTGHRYTQQLRFKTLSSSQSALADRIP